MTESVRPPVIDASPLIFLAKADLLSLLRYRYDEVLITSTVAAEIRQYGVTDLTYKAVQGAEWLSIVELLALPQVVQDYNIERLLDTGMYLSSSVIKQALAIVDEV